MKITIKKLKRTIRPVLIFLTALVLLHTFVSCGGLPASQIGEKETQSKIIYVDPPEFEPIEIGTVKPFEYEGNPVLPEYREEITYRPTTTTRYAASRKSNKYHRPSCRYVDTILSENLVYYNTEEEAWQDGKAPCIICKP